MKKIILLSATLLGLTSCATMLDGGNPTICLNGDVSEPVTIITEAGTYENVTLPANVEVKRHKLEGQRIQVVSENYVYQDLVLRKERNPLAYINLSNIFGWAIDALSNSVVVPSQTSFYVSGTPKNDSSTTGQKTEE